MAPDRYFISIDTEYRGGRYMTRAASTAYSLCDCRVGMGDPVARVYDAELAERIVRLLNADVETVERQGAKVA